MSNILSWAMESLSLPLALDFVFELSSTERTTNSIQLHTLTKFNLASLSANTDEKFSSRDQLIQETEEAQPALFQAGQWHTLSWNISTVNCEGCCLEMKSDSFQLAAMEIPFCGVFLNEMIFHLGEGRLRGQGRQRQVLELPKMGDYSFLHKLKMIEPSGVCISLIIYTFQFFESWWRQNTQHIQSHN